MSQSGPDKKIANSLVALGSAAVLAVYTAGFYKTKAAAAHLEELESRVKLGTSTPHGDPPSPISLQAASRPVADLTEVRPPAPVPPAPVKTEAARPAAPKVAVAAPTVTEVKPEIKETPVAASVPEPPPPAPVVLAPPPPPPPPPPPAAPPKPVWKDGTYTGWGSARHGSIEASVVITDGHIASAKIEQCSMRYPCSQIDHLVPQVAQKGDPEKIDYVSGATESSNVFYWAVIDALAKAK